MNAWRAPERIFDAHRLINTRNSVSICGWAGPPTPVATRAGSVPTHERLGLDDRENLQDCWKPAIQLDGRPLPLPPSQHAVSWKQRNIAVTENVHTVLTVREIQIMRLVSEGLSNKEIGRRLNIADGTIKVHLHNIFQKLEISNRTVLAALAILQNDVAGVDFPGGGLLR